MARLKLLMNDRLADSNILLENYKYSILLLAFIDFKLVNSKLYERVFLDVGWWSTWLRLKVCDAEIPRLA